MTAGTTPGAAGTTPGASGTGTPGAAGTGTTGASGTGTGASGTRAATAGTGTATAGTGTATAGTGTTTAGTGGTAGTGAMPGAAGFKMCGKPPKEGMCKANAPGVYAMKVDADVWFMDENNPAPGLYDAGRGTISIFLKGDLTEVCEDGTGGVGTVTTCGDVIPPLLVGLTCGVIQIVFPDEMWEKPGMPKVVTTGSTTGFNPMDILSFAKGTGIYGIEMVDAAATWPTYMQTATYACKDGKKGKDCFPDHDGDSNPGITVKLKTDGTPTGIPYTCPLGPWTYVPAPVDLAQAALAPQDGASETYIGLRTSVAGGGKIGADCKSGTGPAEASAFESRLFDCKLKNGSKCSVAAATFVDTNLPNFHVLQAGQTPPANWMSAANAMINRMPSKGPQGSMIRLADPGTAVTCEQVRKAAFPAAN